MILSNPENPRKQNDRPSILVFDVNETLLDIDAMAPLFAHVFGDARVHREWFGQLVLYSGVVTLSRLYQDFFALGQGVLGMLAEIHNVDIHSSDMDELKTRMLNMPAHPDVSPGLSLLKDAGFRLVTLTNSPTHPQGSPLERAGMSVQCRFRSAVQTRAEGVSDGRIYVGRSCKFAVHGRIACVGHNWRAECRLLGGAPGAIGKCTPYRRRVASTGLHCA